MTMTCTAEYILNCLKKRSYSVAELMRETKISIKQLYVDLDWLFDNGLAWKRNCMTDDGNKLVLYKAVPEKDLTPFSKDLLYLQLLQKGNA